MKMQAIDWDIIFARHIASKDSLPRIYKEFSELSIMRKNSWVFKIGKKKKDTQAVNMHIKKYSTWFIFRGMQIKTTVIYHYAPIRMTKI